MSEYTDLSCNSLATAKAVQLYLDEQLAQAEELPTIAAYVEKSTLRLTYGVEVNRLEWDMQLLGYRDGLQAGADAARREDAGIVKDCEALNAAEFDAKYGTAAITTASAATVKAILSRVGQPVDLQIR